jgi:hypothetical protein
MAANRPREAQRGGPVSEDDIKAFGAAIKEKMYGRISKRDALHALADAEAVSAMVKHLLRKEGWTKRKKTK